MLDQAPLYQTMPPSKYTAMRFHWLFSVRASNPVIVEWVNGQWHTSGEDKPISPEAMYERRWEWYAPVLPPPAMPDSASTINWPGRSRIGHEPFVGKDELAQLGYRSL